MESIVNKSEIEKDIVNNRLKKELSHVSWLLYECCIDEINDKNRDLNVINNYFSTIVAEYGFPKISKIYDNYNCGYWMRCVWGEHEDWIWMSTQKSTFKDLMNNMYWCDIENSISNSEYIWDGYYNGWWIFSEWNKTNNCLEWIWWG